jgi:hypothetical protein
MAPLLASLPCGSLFKVSLQFPDPWFREKHKKRRVLQIEWVQCLTRHMAVGGQVFVSSDVEEVLDDARAHFSRFPQFQLYVNQQRQGQGQGQSLSPGDGGGEPPAPPTWPAPTTPSGMPVALWEGVTDEKGYLQANPTGVPSERDNVCEAMWRRVFRLIYVRVY